ncbi:MAG: hypothetical protein ABI882_17395 [Acidobacteriota bacterium]
MKPDLLGWTSSAILVATLSRQIYKQWHTESSEGVSEYLFIGQVAASTGFLIYSWLLSSWVFVVTNSLLLLNALIGVGIMRWQNRARGSGAGSESIRRGPPALVS